METGIIPHAVMNEVLRPVVHADTMKALVMGPALTPKVQFSDVSSLESEN